MRRCLKHLLLCFDDTIKKFAQTEIPQVYDLMSPPKIVDGQYYVFWLSVCPSVR